jgi:hypothetical protein
MVLCSICQSIDIRSLLLATSAREHTGGDDPEFGREWHRHGKSNFFRHHDDIFQVLDSANGGCDLCNMIWSAFDQMRVEKEGSNKPVAECAKGLPIIPGRNLKEVLVSFDSPEGLIRLCGFDIYRGGNGWMCRRSARSSGQ